MSYRKKPTSHPFYGTLARANRLRNERKLRKGYKPPIRPRYELPYGGHPFAEHLRNVCRKANGRIRNWSGVIHVSRPPVKGSYLTIDCGRYSRGCSYTKYEYRPMYFANAYILTKKRAVIVHGFKGELKSFTLMAPAGHFWRRDELGLALVRKHGNTEYHPAFFELVGDPAVVMRKLVECIDRKVEVSKLRDMLPKIDDKEVYVCRSDSWEAGNCAVGTDRFAQINSIANGHIRANRLLAIGERTQWKDRVAAAVSVAKKRHVRDLIRGYSDLGYHSKK